MPQFYVLCSFWAHAQGNCMAVSPPLPATPFLPCSPQASSSARLKFLFSAIFSNYFHHFHDFCSFVWWKRILDWSSVSHFLRFFVFWLHILANSRYPTNSCSMNELQIKDVSWKYCGSELSKVILKLLQKGTRAIPSRSEILLGNDLLEQSGFQNPNSGKAVLTVRGCQQHISTYETTHTGQQVNTSGTRTPLSRAQQPQSPPRLGPHSTIQLVRLCANWPHPQWHNWRGHPLAHEKQTQAVSHHLCSVCSRWHGTPRWWCSVFFVGVLEPKITNNDESVFSLYINSCLW